jgi:RNA polymerase sigma factor (sigma-70 family)
MHRPSETSNDFIKPNDEQGSLSVLFAGLDGCDPAVFAEIWRRFFPRMAGLARKTMARFPRLEIDEVDVAQSAFVSFWRAWKDGAGFKFDDRDDLWKLLSVMTARKAMKSSRRRLAKKRGGGHVVSETDLANGEGSASLEEVASRLSPPEFDLVCEEMLLRLTDDERAIVVLRMQNFTNEEIAERMDCSVRTVQRTLEGVRRGWEVD